MNETTPCPCGSGDLHQNCCQPLLRGKHLPATAAALMRSRYTAYVLRDVPYLLATWHPSTRPLTMDPATIPAWRRLQIIACSRGNEDEADGVVEFVATAVAHDRPLRLHEVSRFVREDGRWFYVDGDLVERGRCLTQEGGKVGRNVLCPCGSGRKFKRCCGA